MDQRKTKSLADQRRLREEGEAAIVATLREVGPLSRLELSKRANLGRTTVFEIVRDLVSRSILVEAAAESEHKGRGRPTTVFSLNPATALFAGVEVARRHIRVLLVNAAHEEIAYEVEPLPTPGDASALDIVLDLLPRAAHKCGSSLDQIKHIGLGVSGIVDPLVPSAAIQRLQAGMEGAFHVPVKVANNSHLASLAEATWGAARDHDDVLYVHWSSGIGSGWVSRRSLLHGAHGMAGELGHVSIEPEHGPECYCGGRGCLEMLAGLEALGRRAASLPSGGRFANERDLLAAARTHDATATGIFREAALQIGQVVATAATLLDPSIVVLGGEVSALGETVIEPLRTAIERMVTPRFQRTIEVRPSRLGELAAVRGAVALVLPEVQFSTN
jgi:predicted NBD/HSP70 family sugar kinase